MPRWIGLGWIAACHGGEPASDVPTDAVVEGDADADADADSDVDLPTREENLTADCVVGPNPLRATCSAAFDSPLTLRIELSRSGEDPLVFTSSSPATDPTLPVWGLIEGTA